MSERIIFPPLSCLFQSSNSESPSSHCTGHPVAGVPLLGSRQHGPTDQGPLQRSGGGRGWSRPACAALRALGEGRELQ